MLSKPSSMPMCSWGQVKKNGASFARACSHLKRGIRLWHTNQQHLPIIVQVKVNPGRVGTANNPPWSTLVIGLLGLPVIGWMIITLGFCLKRMLVLQLLQSNTILFARKIYSSKHLACMCYLSIFDLIRIRYIYIISIQIVLV